MVSRELKLIFVRKHQLIEFNIPRDINTTIRQMYPLWVSLYPKKRHGLDLNWSLWLLYYLRQGKHRHPNARREEKSGVLLYRSVRGIWSWVPDVGSLLIRWTAVRKSSSQKLRGIKHGQVRKYRSQQYDDVFVQHHHFVERCKDKKNDELCPDHKGSEREIEKVLNIELKKEQKAICDSFQVHRQSKIL